MKIKIGSKIDVGKVRDHQEDDMLIAPDALGCVWEHDTQQLYDINENLALMAIADGMGGMNAGEIASAIAISSLQSFFSNQQGPIYQPDKLPGLLTEAITLAHQEILSRGGNTSSEAGMGTTIVAVVLYQNIATIGWVGDSRCYLKRNDEKFQQLTKDHSLVQDLIDKGALTQAQASFHPQRNVILQSLGSQKSMSPDVVQVNLKRNDKLLLCSDGLNGMLSDNEIDEILTLSNEPQNGADSLVKAALLAGGHDNISVIVAAIDPSDQKHLLSPPPYSKKPNAYSTAQTGFPVTAIIIALLTFGLIAIAIAFIPAIRPSVVTSAEPPPKKDSLGQVSQYPVSVNSPLPDTSVPPPASAWHPEDYYVLRVNVFVQRENATETMGQLQKKYPDRQIVVNFTGDFFEVIITKFSDRKAAEHFKAKNPELKESIVYRQKSR